MRNNIDIDDALMAEAQKVRDTRPRDGPWKRLYG
jgi:Arc/MetJ family transcription regulator